MAGKVFHADPDTHRRVMAYCKEHKLSAKDWVSRVLNAALNGNGHGDTAAVEMKAVPQPPPRKHDPADPPWAKPPFWEKEKDDGAKEDGGIRGPGDQADG